MAGDFYRILAISASPRQAAVLRAARGGCASRASRARPTRRPRSSTRRSCVTRHGWNRWTARLGLTVQVSKGRRPIDGPIAVTATMTRPRVAIGDVLAAVKPLKAGSRGTEPGMTDAERQVAAFLQDPRRRERLRPVERDRPARWRRSRRFPCRAGECAHSGPLSRRGAHQRRRPPARPHRTQPDGHRDRCGSARPTAQRAHSRCAPCRGNRAIELMLRPADRRGNLLGPAFAGQIRAGAVEPQDRSRAGGSRRRPLSLRSVAAERRKIPRSRCRRGATALYRHGQGTPLPTTKGAMRIIMLGTGAALRTQSAVTPPSLLSATTAYGKLRYVNMPYAWRFAARPMYYGKHDRVALDDNASDSTGADELLQPTPVAICASKARALCLTCLTLSHPPCLACARRAVCCTQARFGAGVQPPRSVMVSEVSGFGPGRAGGPAGNRRRRTSDRNQHRPNCLLEGAGHRDQMGFRSTRTLHQL